MNKITINFLNQSINIAIDTYKVILGSNFNQKFRIIQSLKHHFEKASPSEYSIQKNYRNSLYIDEHFADIRRYDFIEVNHHFNLNQDLKLGSKSLLLKYYNSILSDIEYNDLVNTINILLSDLNNEIIEERARINLDSIELSSLIQSLNYKNIIKLLELNLFKEEAEANAYNFTYNELLLFQLDLISKIAQYNQDKEYFVLMDIPSLSQEIIKALTDDVSNNIKVLILTNCIEDLENINYNNISYLNKQFIDLTNEEHLYDILLMELSFVATIEEVRNLLIEYLKGNINEKNCEIIKLL